MIDLQKNRGCLSVRGNAILNKITTIRATKSMIDSLVKEVIQELTHNIRGTEVEAVQVKAASRQREAIRIARTVVKITKSPNL